MSPEFPFLGIGRTQSPARVSLAEVDWFWIWPAGRNGLFLASRGLPVILADRSAESLAQAGMAAEGKGPSGMTPQG